jgi:hypothetical protein
MELSLEPQALVAKAIAAEAARTAKRVVGRTSESPSGSFRMRRHHARRVVEVRWSFCEGSMKLAR